MTDFLTRNKYFDELCSMPGLLWMGQNTNHIPTHPAVQEAMLTSIQEGEFNAYAPPLGFEALREAIIKDLGVKGVEAIITDGGVNALAMICRAYCRPGTTLVTTDPTWKWPGLFATQEGASVIEIPIYSPETNYKLTPEALESVVDDRTSIIYLVDPNNPLGICYSQSEIEAFSEIAQRHDAILIHDCTYRDFAPSHYPALKASTKNTIVTLSFSKWLGLAGLRIGAFIADVSIAEKVANYATGVLGANVVAQRAALAGLAVKKDWMKTVLAIDNANKEKLKIAAENVGFTVPVYPSNGNFLVIETLSAGVRPEALVACSKKEGIMIRQGTYHTAQFGDRFIKVSTTVPEEWVDRLCDRLPDLVKEARDTEVVEPLF